jgi:hypothetical protein
VEKINILEKNGSRERARATGSPWKGYAGNRHREASMARKIRRRTLLNGIAGVADDLDHLNGTTMSMEEINAAGGILGRQLKLCVTDIDKLAPDYRRSRRRVHW